MKPPAGAARRDATPKEIAVARLLAGCWKFQSGAPEIYRPVRLQTLLLA
jgi:hypothetical protein